MAKVRRKRMAVQRDSARAAPVRWAPLLPGLVAIVLSIPCLQLGYFWDDYLFLNQREGGDVPSFLFPDPHAAFYRPISQGAYFLLLRLLDPSNGILGHLLNLAALTGAITLLALLVSRLSGSRAGLFAALVLACLGAIPSLVAWISCSQDLLAIVFVLAAFLLRHERREVAALACATAAVFCKEPAVAAFPVLALWDYIVGRPAARSWIHITAYGVVLLVWICIHPGIRLLLGRGFQSGATGYVGLEGPERWGTYLGRYVMSLFNLPPLGFTKAPLDDRIPYGLGALLTMAVGIWYLDRRHRSERPGSHVPMRRVALMAALFGIPTLLMPTLLVRHWAPYFVCIPAVAFAMLLGPILARQRTIVALVVLGVFLLLGIRYRSALAVGEPAWTESVFVTAADAGRQVRGNFEKLLPSLPRGSQVVISTASTGVRGVHSTLVDNQALRSWYRDSSIRTVTTLRRPRTASPEFLVRITTDLDVISINPDSYDIRSTMAYPPDMNEIGRPLRNYARAVAAGGETDRAIRIFENLGRAESPEGRIYTDRLIAMVLLAANRREEADRIMAAGPEFLREDALALVKRLQAEATSSDSLDEASFEAFGLSATDPETLRWMMRDFRKDGLMPQAAWFAERLQRLIPGDSEADGMLTAAAALGIKPNPTPG